VGRTGTLTGMPSMSTFRWIGLALGVVIGALVGVLWEGGAGFGVGVALGGALGVSAATLAEKRRLRHGS
jgi:hypothetical protein